MRILVTGSKGFIGKRLCNALKNHGHEIIEFDQNLGDLCAPDSLDGLEQIDMVYHLAARTFVPDSWTQTYDYIKTNVIGTEVVLELCRKTKAKLLFMSTYVYGPPQYLPVDELHPVNPVSPYHESKLLGESLCNFYNAEFGVNVVIFRPFNVYGEGQNQAFVLSKIAKQVLDPNTKEIVVSNLKPKRDYIYIKDVIEALINVQNCADGLQILNIGTGLSTSVEDAIKTMLSVSGTNKPYRESGQKRNGDILDCYADCNKAQKMLNFKAKYTLVKGISNWFSEV